MQYGRRLGLATVRQEALLNASLNGWTASQQQYVRQQIGQGRTILGQFLLLESLLAGDQAPALQSFAGRINPLTDAQMLEQCSVRTTQRSLIQQWQNSCSITVVQTFLADICPRYAYELRTQPDYSVVMPNQPDGIAQQQQQLLRQYGGQCSPRGTVSGGDIGLNGPLNDFVGKILRVSFGAVAVSPNTDETFGAVRAQLAVGLCVPVRININPGAGHFLLVLDSRSTASGPAFLLYEPFNGLTGYVLESTLKQGSLAPLNTSWQFQFTHYYPGQPVY